MTVEQVLKNKDISAEEWQALLHTKRDVYNFIKEDNFIELFKEKEGYEEVIEKYQIVRTHMVKLLYELQGIYNTMYYE